MENSNKNKDKKWNDYSNEDKSNILNHWFYYYGGVLVTLEEIEEFRKLAMTRQDDIFNYIVTSSLINKTIQTNVLVAYMRENRVDELFEHLIDMGNLSEPARRKVEAVRDFLIKEIVHTYLFPEPPVPMNIQIVIDEEEPGMGLK